MIKIAHVEEMHLLQHLPQEVVMVVEEIAEILDNEYGINRGVDGCVAFRRYTNFKWFWRFFHLLITKSIVFFCTPFSLDYLMLDCRGFGRP